MLVSSDIRFFRRDQKLLRTGKACRTSPTCLREWSGGAMVLGKLPVPGRPTIWITVGQGPTALTVGAGGGCLDIFTLLYPFSPLSPSLWETARYRLKYCFKGPLNPKQPTNQPTCFWSSLINLISKDDYLVFYLSCITGLFKSIQTVKQMRRNAVFSNSLTSRMRYDVSL